MYIWVAICRELLISKTDVTPAILSRNLIVRPCVGVCGFGLHARGFKFLVCFGAVS